MDYKEKYEAALDAAKHIYDDMKSGGNFGGMEDLEVIFPELSESEDERIRKELLAVINDLVLPDEQRARFNAWLEKQKEQKPSELSEEEESQIWQIANNAAKTFDEAFAILTATKKAYNKGRKDAVKEQNPAEYLDKDKVYAIMKKLHDLAFSQLIPINSDEYKKIDEITGDVRRLLDYPIKQNPVDSLGKAIVSRIDVLTKLVTNGTITISDYLYLTQPKEQKPVNISENNDSDVNGHLTGKILVEYGAHAKVRDGKRHCEMDWKEFQRLAHYFYELGKAEQHPVEWSEEDERHIESITRTIERYMEDNPASAEYVLGYCDDDIAWLKSLRPCQPCEVDDYDKEREERMVENYAEGRES